MTRLRCIAYHAQTGKRCPRRVSKQKRFSDLYLCPRHAKSWTGFWALIESTGDFRRRLALGRWRVKRD